MSCNKIAVIIIGRVVVLQNKFVHRPSGLSPPTRPVLPPVFSLLLERQHRSRQHLHREEPNAEFGRMFRQTLRDVRAALLLVLVLRRVCDLAIGSSDDSSDSDSDSSDDSSVVVALSVVPSSSMHYKSPARRRRRPCQTAKSIGQHSVKPVDHVREFVHDCS